MINSIQFVKKTKDMGIPPDSFFKAHVIYYQNQQDITEKENCRTLSLMEKDNKILIKTVMNQIYIYILRCDYFVTSYLQTWILLFLYRVGKHMRKMAFSSIFRLWIGNKNSSEGQLPIDIKSLKKNVHFDLAF